MDAEREKEDLKREESRKSRLMEESELPDWLLREDDDVRIYQAKNLWKRH